MNKNLSESRVWAKAGKWLILGLILAVGGCFYGGRQKSTGTEEVIAGEQEDEFAWQELSEETGESLRAESKGEEDTEEETEQEDFVCYVYVCGQVVSPGVYEMEEGQRIYEAVEQAGGFTEKARPEYLNLAEPVTDGMKIWVPDEALTEKPDWNREQGLDAGAGKTLPSKKVNINSATKEELMTLTGIGESRAAEIIRYRTESGAFSKIEDIMNVPGIKEGFFQKIQSQIEV